MTKADAIKMIKYTLWDYYGRCMDDNCGEVSEEILDDMIMELYKTQEEE